MDWKHALVLFAAAALAGAVNSVAGGGTLLTFPALLWTGEIAKVANATSTVALWPGQLSSLFGYRKELGENRDAIARLGIPSLLGGIVGALLFIRTPPGAFARLVPYLILLATFLFVAQEPLARWQRAKADRAAGGSASGSDPEHNRDELSAGAWAGVIVFQFFVANPAFTLDDSGFRRPGRRVPCEQSGQHFLLDERFTGRVPGPLTVLKAHLHFYSSLTSQYKPMRFPMPIQT